MVVLCPQGDKLETLSLCDASRVDELNFSARLLKRLDLKNCPSLASFARPLPSLLRADLEFCTNLDDRTVEKLLELAPLLEVFFFPHFFFIFIFQSVINIFVYILFFVVDFFTFVCS